MRILPRAVVVLLIFSCQSAKSEEKLPLPVLDQKLRTELTSYLQTHYQTPEQYVISKFQDHDIVILGENHRARHDPLLVQALIPPLYGSGIYILGTEFARRIDQPLIDSLLNAGEYDEELANEITLRQFVNWGYREYVDIFRAAWRLNKSLRPGERRFRILALGNAPDWSIMKTQADRENSEIKKLVWHGETEKDWANVLLKEVADKKEKALVYCGIHHGFTEYRQPIVNDKNEFTRFNEDRLGRYLYNAIGKRVITIYLHNSWVSIEGVEKPSVYAADGYIDAVMASMDSTRWRVGFDTKGTPFEKLTGKTAYYSQGYSDFNLGMFCDGYIFQMSFSRYEPVTCIEGYYTEKNIDYARRNAVNPWFRDKPISEFEESCEESRRENRQWWSRFH